MEQKGHHRSHRVTLKMLAQHLKLTPGTVSKVLNNANGSDAISPLTKARILDAARELQYKPNFLAQSLRTKRSYMIGVLLPEIGESDSGLVVAGIERLLRQRGYLFLTGVHHRNDGMLESYISQFQQRGVEGVIVVDVDFPYESALPTVPVAIPRNWSVEERAAFAPTWGSSSWPSSHSRRFIERVGEVATEMLLAKIQDSSDELLPLSSHPELAGSTHASFVSAMNG
jgi:DNA-binding LacI/PurR family transcriptional regulator